MGTKRLKRPLRACDRDDYHTGKCEMQPGVSEFLTMGLQALWPKHLHVNSVADVDHYIQVLLGSNADYEDDNLELPFSQKLYLVFCALFARTKAETSATAELLVLRLREAEARIAQLEAAPKLEYVGVYVSSRNYVPGQFVTYAGSLWHCNAPTGGKSGFDKSCWTLAVKRGVDAKPVLTVAA
ncbi:hypothetical protein RLW55_03225 [Hyphomicrobium sp. B1]|uniref:hypothetical protein n=1 Tax=Hyphomicrobium sp. B1 TaxID=3075651 RepID=UPI003C30A386